MARYYYIWHKSGSKVRRKFTFDFRSVPMKYRNSMATAEPWAKMHLARKYGIPVEKVIITESGGLYR